MKKKIFSFISEEIFPVLGRQRECSHSGEFQEFCGKCGKDLREIASYECRFCSLLNRNTVYPGDDAPDFCKKCGAPKFTFSARKIKRSSGDKNK